MRRLTKIAAVTAMALAVTRLCQGRPSTGSERRPSGAAPAAAGPRSAWPTTSAAAATSRSTTRPPPAWRRPARSSATCNEAEAVPARPTPPGGAPAHARRRGYNPIVAVGFVYPRPSTKVATEYPDIKFAVIDGSTAATSVDNVPDLAFAEEQGSFLVGAAAALKTKTKHVGFIGGVKAP